MQFNPKFTKDELYRFLLHKGIEEDDATKIKEEKIDGETFQDISEDDLKEIGLKLGTRKKIMKIIQNFKTTPKIQSYTGNNSQLQEFQILSGDPVTNKLVFDLITAGSSCTVLPNDSSGNTVPQPSTQNFSSPVQSFSLPSSQIRPSPTQATSSSQFHLPSVQIESSPSPSPLPSSSLSSSVEKSTSSRGRKRISISSIIDSTFEENSEPPKNTYYNTETIDVKGMLDGNFSGQKILKSLKSGKGITRSEISEIVRIVVCGMIADLKTLYPRSEQKHNLAKAIVRDIPELKSNRDGVEGCEQFYDPRNNSGSIEWRLKTLRVSLPPSKRKKHMRASLPSPEEIAPPVEEEIVFDENVIEKICWLKSQPPLESNKAEIIEAMAETFSVRRNFIVKGSPTITEILEEYPKLKDFDGALIDIEFQRLYPNAENLLERLPEYTEKLKQYVGHKRRDIEERIMHVADENLKTMMRLADLLPIPGMRRKKKEKVFEEKTTYHPSESLIVFTGSNSSLFQEEPARHLLLLCCGEIEDEESQYFLILDKEYVDVGKCFIKAFDILYKSHFVFNVEYPRQLVAFYNFLDHLIYKVNTGCARSSVEHLNNVLCSMK